MAVASSHSPETSLPPAAKPRRRWYQFTLRTAGVWMVLLCLLLGSFAWWRDRAERQRKVVEELRGLGAKVEYRYFSRLKWISNEVHPRSQEYFFSYWARYGLGDDFLYDVDSISLASSYNSAAIPPEMTRSALSSLRKCRRLRVLSLEANAVRGGDLEQLPFLESLEVLSLYSVTTGIRPQLTDGDMAVLVRATCLRRLYLDGLPIGDAAIQHLRGLRQLRALTLSESNLGDEGLKDLRELSELVELDLHHTLITDEGLKHLRGLNRLRDLNLSQNAIIGEGFADFGPKAELVGLDLRETKFTDAALRHLTQFPNLEQLYLHDTQITGCGISQLAGLAGIDGIRLDRCPVTDDGIANVEIPQGWKSFSLSGTKITDQGVFRLKLPPSVTKLWLNDSVVTDSSLDNLLRFPNLEWVFVNNTRITPEGIKRFGAQHPSGEAVR